MEKILSKTPSINHVFERERKSELKRKLQEGEFSPEEKKEYKRFLTADVLFEHVSCLQTQRKAVKDVNKEVALLGLDTVLVVGTMGLGSTAVAGRIALRMGGPLSKAQKGSKAKRFQNAGIFGADVSLSAPYMQEAMNICEDELNQLEETAEETNKVCEKLSIGVKHTSNVKSCILQASLASLPITLPILGLAGIAVAKGIRGAKTSSSAQKAEEVLGLRLSSSQRRAVEEAHLIGQGERGKNGALAGIGNYTEDQLRRKADILNRAGFSKNQRRQLMEAGVVGDDLLRRADKELEKALRGIRKTPEEPSFKAKGFKPEYYRGYDKAREFNAVKEWAEKVKADRYRTHIPYFADQLEKHIADFEKSFRRHNKDKPEFLEKRLKLLEELKQEARQRIKDQNVTYDWWANFNVRMPMIAEEPDIIREDIKNVEIGRDSSPLL